MLVSTLVPLGLVLAVGAVVVAVLRARHRKNVGESQECPCPPSPTLSPWTSVVGLAAPSVGLLCSLLFHRL